MKEEKMIFKRYAALVVLGVCLFVGLQNLHVVLGFLEGLLSVVMPFIVGLCMAFVLNVLLKFIEEKVFVVTRINRVLSKKIQRPISILLSYITVIALLFVLMFLVIPELVRTIQTVVKSLEIFLNQLPAYMNQIANEFNISPEMLGSVDISTNTSKFIENGLKFLTEGSIGVFNITISLTSSIFGSAFNAIMSLAFSIYALFHKEKLAEESKRTLRAFLKNRQAERIIEVARLSNDIFAKFVFGQLTEATILGSLCAIGMTLFGLPYALMVGVVVGFTALIPVFGAFLGIGVGAVVLAITSLEQAILFIVFMIILQQLEGNMIYPRVVGKSIGLPSIWVLLAVLVGGNLMGATGMLIGVPLASVIYALLKKEVNKKLEEKQVY